MFGTPIRGLIKRAMRACPALFNPLWSVAYSYVYRRYGGYLGSGSEYVQHDRASTFRLIFEENHWGSNESRSGVGSTLAQTKPIRRALPRYLRTLNVSVLLDAPCGDFNWMRHVSLPDGTVYIGGDIVAPLVDELQRVHSDATHSFRQIDIVADPIPNAGLWLCRAALYHLPNRDVMAALENFVKADIPYLLTTTFPFSKQNDDIEAGGFRYLNLEKPPFALPRPISRIADFVAPEPPEYLGLWSRDQVAKALNSRGDREPKTMELPAV